MKNFTTLFSLLSLLLLVGCTPRKEVVYDPYAEVDWSTTLQLRSALHVHTANSTIEHGPEEGTTVTPAEQIDRYEELGYDVVAITDHDYVSYPWSNYGKGDSQLVAIEANELSKNDNMCSYFCNWLDLPGTGPATTVGFDESIRQVGLAGGIVYLAHPMRSGDICHAEFSAEVFRNYAHVYGMEVLNVGQFKRNNSIELWDELLTLLMPERRVWGTSSDDAHSTSMAGKGWTTMLTTERTPEAVRRCMTDGAMLFSTPLLVEGAEGEVPAVRAICHNPKATTITIEVAYTDRVEWVSCGRVVATGESIDYADCEGVDKYLRAVLYGPGGATFTQPYAIR